MLNRKHSSLQLAGMKNCLYHRPKPLFYKWKPQRQLCLTGYGLAEGDGRSSRFSGTPKMWLSTVKAKQTNKNKQTKSLKIKLT